MIIGYSNLNFFGDYLQRDQLPQSDDLVFTLIGSEQLRGKIESVNIFAHVGTCA
jgi:hypothetical protein